MISTKIPTTNCAEAGDPKNYPENIIERVRKLKALNGQARQVGISQDAVREFTVLRLKLGY